ncbi:hypothetical protein L6164_033978 [Bauhinia variegata]|uniref:Uncharacterized protein n=1 Tax=Bauhinia variegata TaxID=167791 RepID=A0ACB9KTI3_BAUVA|nr:hypothetical protein L6164_033978 [Bauhinia variegata]
MVKTKQRRTRKVPGNKNGTPLCPIDSSDSDHQHDTGDWVIVKRQRVTILVPAASVPKRAITENIGPSRTQLTPLKIASNHSQPPLEISTPLPLVNEPEKTISLPAQKGIQVSRKALPSLRNSTLVNPSTVDQRIEVENPREVCILKSCNLLGVSKTSRAMKKPRIALAPSMPPKLSMSLNQGLRASNLERKLERAGGLSRWLTSLGLGQFVRIFRGRSINKYQLVNLTMKKLKDMGASAVGPRRKLIHAIECVCQPCCFETL